MLKGVLYYLATLVLKIRKGYFILKWKYKSPLKRYLEYEKGLCVQISFLQTNLYSYDEAPYFIKHIYVIAHLSYN